MTDMEIEKKEKIPKVLLFYNPTSGSGMFKKNLDHIVHRFEEKGMIVVPIRALSGIEADDIIGNISDDDYVKIIAAGGDGTINVIVNAMMRHDRHIPLAVFPAGTANDFAHYFHIPSHLDGMIDVALQDHYIPADIGRYNDKYFINVLSMGAVIDVSHKTKSSMKNSLGMFAYYLKAASELPSLHAVPITVDAVDEFGNQLHIEEKVLFLLQRTAKPIGVIASMCGYNSDDSLRRTFLKRTGISMRQWRKGALSERP